MSHKLTLGDLSYDQFFAIRLTADDAHYGWLDSRYLWPPIAGGAPANPNKSVQFNDDGVFGGDADLIWDKATKRMRIGGTGIPLSKLAIIGSEDIPQLIVQATENQLNIPLILLLDSNSSELARIYVEDDPINNMGIGKQALRLGGGRSGGAICNLAIGYESLYSNDEGGSRNLAIGYKAMHYNIIGMINTAIGHFSLFSNIDGYHNIGVGDDTLYNNVDGYGNIAVGADCLMSNIHGSANLAIGMGALFNTIGSNNIALGYCCATNLTMGSNNIFIGCSTDAPSPTADYQMLIGDCLHGVLNLGYIGIGAIPTKRFSVMEKFQVDDNGDPIKIKNVAYIWPSTGAAGFFYRDANGNVSFQSGEFHNRQHALSSGDDHTGSIDDNQHGSRGAGLHADSHARQHSITSTDDHQFPGGTDGFLRKDGTFVMPPGASLDDFPFTPNHTWEIDHFLGFDLSKWHPVIEGECTVEMFEFINGCIRLVSDGGYVYINKNDIGNWIDWFRYKFNWHISCNGDATIEIGLSGHAEDGNPDDILDKVIFRHPKGEPNWWVVTKKEGSETTTDTGIAFSGAWVKLLAHYTSEDDMNFYIDDVLVATHIENIPTILLQPYAMIQDAEASLLIDYWKAKQNP